MMWTIGHGTRSLAELVELLRGAGVSQLVDVRTIPRSRHNPQFNRDTLPEALAETGIAYLHLPGLGGLRRPRPDSVNGGWRNTGFRGYADHMHTPEFARNLDVLIERSRSRPTAVMCAEAVPWRCHRSLLADALTVRGIRVEHILGAGHSELHELTPWARVDGTSITYPVSASGAPGARARSPRSRGRAT